MDSMRPSTDVYDDVTADAPGLEAPPIIGTDERRMHVRAYNFWARLLEGRSFPSIEALDTDQLGDFGPNSVLLDFTSGIENPAISFVGSAISAECGLDDSVQYISDVPRRSLLSRLTDHYLQIIANRAPIGFEAEFVNERGATILYRGVLMPFSSDDDTIDFILGVINWKQAADAQLADHVSAELEAELAASSLAPPHARPVAPVWADGPDAIHGANDDAGDADGDGDGDYGDDAEQAAADDAGYADDGDYDDGDVIDLAAYAADRDDTMDRAEVAHDFNLVDGYAAADLPDDAAAGEDAEDYDAPLLLDTVVATPPLDPAEATLADWLAQARDSADLANQAHVRGRAALYDALGQAWGFACAASQATEDYAEMLSDAGIAPSQRSPMTPVVKLVFGAGYDKTRVAEYASILTHAADEQIPADGLSAYIARHPNGIKGLVRDIRAARRVDRPVTDPMAGTHAALRRAVPLATVALPYVESEAEFTVLVARRMPDGSHAIVAMLSDADAHHDKVLKAAARGR